MNSKKTLTRDQNRNLFFGLMIIVPIVIFIIFYGIVNFNTLSLAFKKYEPIEGQIGYKTSFAGFENFSVVFKMLSYQNNWRMVTNSLTLWFFKLVVGLSMSIIFSYYVYKKMFGSKFFRVILFLPNVISNLIMVYLFRLVVNDAVVGLKIAEMGLLTNPETRFMTIVFFNLWLGFAGQTLMFTSAMSSINESTVEAAQIDGVNSINELFYITIPMIFPTFTTFIILGIAEIFVDQMSLLTFYDEYQMPPSVRTVGYYLYQEALRSDVVPTTAWLSNPDKGRLSYSELSAFSLMITLIIIPISFALRKMFDNIDPMKD